MTRHTREFRESAVRQARAGELSLPELAWRLGVSTITLRRWVQAAEIKEKASGKVRQVAAALSPEKFSTSSQRMRLLIHALEQSPATIVITDTDGHILYANPKFSETTGYALDEVIGQNPRFLKSGFTSQDDYRRMWETVSAGREWRGVFHNRRKDGSYYWERAVISPVVDRDGRIANFMAIKENITEVKEAEDARRRLEARLMAVVTAMAEGVLLLDGEGRITLCNASAERMLDRSAGRLVGTHMGELGLKLAGDIGGESPSLTLPEFLAAGADIREAVYTLDTPTGEPRWLSLNARALAEQSALVITLADVTERRRAEKRLRLAATVFDNSVEAIMVTDRDNRIVSVNDAFTEVTGYGRDEVLGRNPSFLASGRHNAAFYADMWHTLEREGRWQGEIWNRRKNGGLFPEWLSISVVRDPAGQIFRFVALFSDITKGRTRGAWQGSALRDPLTDLPRGELLEDRLEQALRRARHQQRCLALIVIDFKGFAALNASHGHPAGDQVLQEAAFRLAAALSPLDTVGRRGSDEFLVILPDATDRRTAGQTAGRLMACLDAPYLVGGVELRLAASLGVACFPDDGEAAADLLAAADAAAFKCAMAGRGSAWCQADWPPTTAASG